MDKKEILEAYRFRHACKEFDPEKKISKEDFEFILETGRLSPSSFGFEPWKFIVVQNEELRGKLLPITWGAQKQLPTSSHYLLILARRKAGLTKDSEHIQYMMKEVQQLPPEVAEKKGDFFMHFLAEDFHILQSEELMFEWAARQAYIAMGNMMTSAAMIGIDSCPVEGFGKDAVDQLLEAEGLLENGQFGLACMVAFGYRVREPRGKTRQPMERLVQWVE